MVAQHILGSPGNLSQFRRFYQRKLRIFFSAFRVFLKDLNFMKIVYARNFYLNEKKGQSRIQCKILNTMIWGGKKIHRSLENSENYLSS